MIKGCQKRVLWVKNIESDCFDEAFFIVSDRGVERERGGYSMVAEANRIISESPITNYFGTEEVKGVRGGARINIARLGWFFAGAAFTVLISLILQIF